MDETAQEELFKCPMCGQGTDEDPLAGLPAEERSRWTVALSVRKARKAAGLSQADLGALCGYNYRTICKIEMATFNLPADRAVRLAQALKLTLDELLQGAVR